MSMILKYFIEELQKAVPHVGEDAPIETWGLPVKSISPERGRIVLEVPEPDEDDFPTFKDKLENVEMEAANLEEKLTSFKKLVSDYLENRDINDEAAAANLAEIRKKLESA